MGFSLRSVRTIAVLLAVALVVSVGGARALAQSQDAGVPKSKPAPQAATTANPATPAVPNEQRLVTLIFSTLMALNHANLTGNYTVFRELGAPGFQSANSAAKLSEIFADLRNRNFDLSVILLLKPHLLRKPEIGAKGMLRVSGYFPTRPEQVNFDLLYQRVEGRWRLFGIAANTSVPQPAATASAASEPGQAAVPSPSKQNAAQPPPAVKPKPAP